MGTGTRKNSETCMEICWELLGLSSLLIRNTQNWPSMACVLLLQLLVRTWIQSCCSDPVSREELGGRPTAAGGSMAECQDIES